ncbi:aminopeptidase M1-like [Phoenix dactylifera]|uniref:Aminopeptidase M1-like n=1 Tax=Phoenix dactylifera TaxID=42345 RepID=A0A8B9A7H9_PHODC|nr:aminopeptidase M1-like [Phoenix dactylifera]XP_038982620.1 aminopeptidase M1-like [Phoenix dactylifera]
MASCPDPNIVLKTLNFLLSSEVRDRDVIYALAGISSEGSETAWSWLKVNWEHISDRWGHHILLTHFIRDIVTEFFADEKAHEIEEFFLSRTKPSIAGTMKQSIEQVRINAKWRSNIESEQNLEELIMKLAQKTSGTGE